MDRVKQTFKKGPQGTSNVVVNTEKELVRVSFIDGDDEGTTFKVDLDNCPESVKTGRFFVSLSGKGDTVYSIRPVIGTFIVKFVRWARAANTPATPKEMVGKFGPYQAMTALLKIFKGDNTGMEIPLFLNYKFVDDGAGNAAIPTSEKSGTAAERLINFLEATGVLDDVIPYTDNLLPMLEKKILKKDQPFSVHMKEGFVDFISSLEGVEVGGTDPEETDEDATDTDPDDDDDVETNSGKTAQVTDDAETSPKGAKSNKIKPDLDEE
jgi:hypothetical protein